VAWVEVQTPRKFSIRRHFHCAAYGQQQGSATLPRNKYTEIRPEKPTSKEEATRPEFKTGKYTTEAIVSEGIDKCKEAQQRGFRCFMADVELIRTWQRNLARGGLP